MENHTVADQIVLLKVRDMCCPPDLKQLKKEVSKLDGVLSVYLDPKKAVMVVTCKPDAKSALEGISKLGKFKEVVRYYPNPNNQHAETDNNTGGGRYKAEGGERKHICEVYIPPPPNYYNSNQYPPSSSHNYHNSMPPRNLGYPPRSSHKYHDSMPPRNSGYPPRQPGYGWRPFSSPSTWYDLSGFRRMPGSTRYGGQGYGMM